MTWRDELAGTLTTLAPALVPGEFVFVSTTDAAPLEGVAPRASVVEDEGVTYVLERADADRLGLAYDFVAAWITLRLVTDLGAVGLTAEVATALAEAGLSCNVLAGAHHDHLLVPVDRAEEALEVLTRWTRPDAAG